MYQEASYVIGIETSQDIFEGMYITAEEPIISLRTAQDDGKKMVLIGGMGHKVGAKIDLEGAYSNLEEIAKSLYSDAKVIYKWNTQDCITLDKIPYIGDFSNILDNVYVATGFKKWGMTTSNIAARIISDKIQGKPNKYEEIFTATRVNPIKNRWEVGEMIKETTNSLVVNKIKAPNDKQNPTCSHLGCELSWNNLDKTWDCPCHGSRFDCNGKQIYGPAIKDVEVK